MSKIDDYIELVNNSVELAKRGKSDLPLYCLDLYSLNSKRNRHLLYNLCNKYDKKYLEIGVYRGGSIIAACLSNCKAGYAIDNFSFSSFSADRWSRTGWPNIKRGLEDNTEKFRLLDKITTINYDIFDKQVKIGDLLSPEKVNIVFLDVEPITPILLDQESKKYKTSLTSTDYINILKNILSSTENQFILIISNTNKDEVVKNIDKMFESEYVNVHHTVELRNPGGGRNDEGWYNGLGIYVLSRNIKKAMEKNDT